VSLSQHLSPISVFLELEISQLPDFLHLWTHHQTDDDVDNWENFTRPTKQ
jgi:hypothetical protein